MSATGAYTAARAAGLAGVPERTLYRWAKSGLLVPEVSKSPRDMLWSYQDLMALRIIAWLRQPKSADDGASIPASKLSTIQRALDELSRQELPVWSHEDGAALVVDRQGHVYLPLEPHPIEAEDGQSAHRDVLDLLRPFESHLGVLGPDLIRPRPTLRIHPGKLSGSPHVEKTRLETLALAALARDGLSNEKILRLYPYLAAEQLSDSLDLEEQLQGNIRQAA